MSAVRNTAAQTGIGLGSAIAVAISWSLNQSVVWAIIHGFFGWFYVIYLLSCLRVWSLMRWPFAQLVVMAVGIRPETRLANDAGLEVARGITVDDQMRTSDPAIFALGECVEHRQQLFGLISPLYDQAKVLAATLMGDAAAFQPVQTATKLKVTGCDLFSAGDFGDAPDREEIVFRDATRGVYKRLVLKDNVLIGAVLYGDTADGAYFFAKIKGKDGKTAKLARGGEARHGEGEMERAQRAEMPWPPPPIPGMSPMSPLGIWWPGISWPGMAVLVGAGAGEDDAPHS